MFNYHFSADIELPVENNNLKLPGNIVIPYHADALIIFVYATGISRFSPRAKLVAQQFQDRGYATLLLDLLTVEENGEYSNRYRIPMLTSRLFAVTKWATSEILTANLPIGYLAADTGTAAALAAAIQMPDKVRAVVSRGGRPDLVDGVLERLRTPLLLLAGSKDDVTVEINRRAYEKLNCQKELVIIPGATHLFEEPGVFDNALLHAIRWFDTCLKTGSCPPVKEYQGE